MNLGPLFDRLAYPTVISLAELLLRRPSCRSNSSFSIYLPELPSPIPDLEFAPSPTPNILYPSCISSDSLRKVQMEGNALDVDASRSTSALRDASGQRRRTRRSTGFSSDSFSGSGIGSLVEDREEERKLRRRETNRRSESYSLKV